MNKVLPKFCKLICDFYHLKQFLLPWTEIAHCQEDSLYLSQCPFIGLSATAPITPTIFQTFILLLLLLQQPPHMFHIGLIYAHRPDIHVTHHNTKYALPELEKSGSAVGTRIELNDSPGRQLGIYVRFRTIVTSIWIRWKNGSPSITTQHQRVQKLQMLMSESHPLKPESG